MVDGKSLKAKYHEAAKKSREDGNSNTVYTFEMIWILKEMADNDVWPDGSFGDADCNVWSAFRTSALKRA